MDKFELHSEYKPTGDQPQAIEKLVKGFKEGNQFQTLLGKIEGAKKCTSSLEAINTPGVEWVMVFSPNVYHKQHVLEAFEAGKHVFSEKPLATTIEDCQAIFDGHQKSGKLFATGFVLRYAPMYRKAKEILESGKLGKVMTIEANENITPSHTAASRGGGYGCIWHRFPRCGRRCVLRDRSSSRCRAFRPHSGRCKCNARPLPPILFLFYPSNA